MGPDHEDRVEQLRAIFNKQQIWLQWGPITRIGWNRLEAG